MQDTVDILLATYNGAAYVTRQIESLLGQSHKTIRLLMRDDGSSDGTRKILESYVAKFPVKMVLLPAGDKLGVIGNFSALMHHATAPYVMFCDQDDVWEPEKISQTLAKMKETEDRQPADAPILIHTDLKVVDGNLNVIDPSFWQYTHLNPLKAHTLNCLLMQNVVTGCTMMINSALLKLAYPIPQQVMMHDWWLALVAAAFGRIEALPAATILYRQHGNNTLGAKKFLSWDYLKQSLTKIRQPQPKKTAQANALLVRYPELLKAEQKELIQAFLSCEKASFFKRAFLINKYGLYKRGCLRNLANILLKS